MSKSSYYTIMGYQFDIRIIDFTQKYSFVSFEFKGARLGLVTEKTVWKCQLLHDMFFDF